MQNSITFMGPFIVQNSQQRSQVRPFSWRQTSGQMSDVAPIQWRFVDVFGGYSSFHSYGYYNSWKSKENYNPNRYKLEILQKNVFLPDFDFFGEPFAVPVESDKHWSNFL